MSVHEIVAVVQKIFHTLEFVGDKVNLTTRKTNVVQAMFEMTIFTLRGVPGYKTNKFTLFILLEALEERQRCHICILLDFSHFYDCQVYSGNNMKIFLRILREIHFHILP